MKRLITVLLAAALILSLSACSGKSEAVLAAESSIKSIGEVTLDSKDKIEQAEEAFSALTEEDRSQVENASILTDAKNAYDALQKQAQAEANAAKADELISAIGQVTTESGAAISAARSAYDALSEEEKTYSTGLQALETAEQNYIAAKAAYAADTISAIGTVTLDSEALITAARAAFDALSPAEQALVPNTSDLENAEQTYAVLWEECAAQAKETLLSKFNVDYDKVQNLSWYMPKQLPQYIDTRSYLIPYMGENNNGVWLCIRYNYTDDDWVFWKSITIWVDGKTYTQSFNYFDIVHDNDGGVVWEYYDEALNFNEDMDYYSIEMLQAIANSAETIVRFNGDNYSHDFTVSAGDKQAIQDTLDLYAISKK